MRVIKANLIYTESLDSFTVKENAYVGIEAGKVAFVESKLPEGYSDSEVESFGEGFLIPGFVDLHFHAPQYGNYGLGFDEQLIPWLNKYTFPEEAKFSDLDYADQVFKQVVAALVRQGTTRVVLLSSLHREATERLMALVSESGIGAYVGKVNMDRNAPDSLREETAFSLEETEKWLMHTKDLYPQVKPILTPRFVPTCTDALMTGLGELALKFNVPVQSHLSENLSECEWVKTLCPGHDSYAAVYEHFGLLKTKSVMAHCVHGDELELACLKRNGTFAAHCPNANNNLSSGIMPVRRYLDAGIALGLGTDVGAGHQVSIKSVMASAIQASKLAWCYLEDHPKPLCLEEAFYLGTKGGGSFFGKVGSFEVGYEFDALYIDDQALRITEGRSLVERLHRFIYVGDDRQIARRFVSGKEL